MNKEVLIKRIQDLKIAIEQSAGNHNGLLGRLMESTHYLEQLEMEEASQPPKGASEPSEKAA